MAYLQEYKYGKELQTGQGHDITLAGAAHLGEPPFIALSRISGGGCFFAGGLWGHNMIIIDRICGFMIDIDLTCIERQGKATVM